MHNWVEEGIECKCLNDSELHWIKLSPSWEGEQAPTLFKWLTLPKYFFTDLNYFWAIYSETHSGQPGDSPLPEILKSLLAALPQQDHSHQNAH